MNDRSRFEETRLPPKDAFYSSLNESSITDDEYVRAHKAWNIFKCKTMQDYHDAHLKTNVLLMVDVFEHFRKIYMENYGLDAAHCYTTPGLTF